MAINTVVLGFVAVIVAFGTAPDDVSRPSEYAQWGLELAETNPLYAALGFGAVVVLVLFGTAADSGVRIGERHR